MPHKRNPIVCERICGLARILRANAHVGLEDVALWHERDISHSSAERVVLPDSTIALDYMLDRTRWLIEGLAVDPERMLRNLEASHGLVFSGRALLRLVEAGMSREQAYELVQRNALAAWDQRGAAARPARGRCRGRGRARRAPISTRSSTSTPCSSTWTRSSTARYDARRLPMPDTLSHLHEASGKVRELYGFGDRLLLVASDRMSAFDVVLPTPIPDKGRVLTALSRFWFERTARPGAQPHDQRRRRRLPRRGPRHARPRRPGDAGQRA